VSDEIEYHYQRVSTAERYRWIIVVYHKKRELDHPLNMKAMSVSRKRSAGLYRGGVGSEDGRTGEYGYVYGEKVKRSEFVELYATRKERAPAGPSRCEGKKSFRIRL